MRYAVLADIWTQVARARKARGEHEAAAQARRNAAGYRGRKTRTIPLYLSRW